MKVLYFDTFAGISGDMTVGALLALGLPLDHLRQQLQQLPFGGYEIAAAPRFVNGIAAMKFDVHVDSHDRTHAHGHAHGRHHVHSHRPYRDIRAMVEASSLAAPVKQTALRIFAKLADAEGQVHGVAADDVEFHEVGAADSIVDIVGSAIGWSYLGIEGAFVSSIPLGSGIVQSQHGALPVPGPATAELLRGFVTRPGDGESELVTPTGAAILAALTSPQAPPPLRVHTVGYGAGQRLLADRPNLLRLVLADTVESPGRDEIVVIETNIDDFNPELYDFVIERLFDAGARDVYLTPIHMKKQRPGIVLSVLSEPADRDRLAAIVLSETSAIGVRFHPVERLVLSREVREVNTPYGSVRVKVARGPDGHANVAPEYDDCKRLAGERQVPIKLVYQAAIAAVNKMLNA